MALNKVCTFATTARYNLHGHGLSVTWYIVSHTDLFGNLAFTIDVWNMKFAGFSFKGLRKHLTGVTLPWRFFGCLLDFYHL